MKRLRAFLAFVFESFGPLIAFLIVYRYGGLLWAIGVSMGVVALEALVLFARRKRPTRLFVMSAVLTLAFGGVDLFLQRSVLFRFEAVITNVLTGLWFGATLFADKTMLLELYETTRKPDDPFPPETPAYLRILTTVWTAYFFLKAALYAWIGLTFPLDRAVALRALIGTVSFVALLGGERLVRRPLFRWMKARGWLSGSLDSVVPAERQQAHAVGEHNP